MYRNRILRWESLSEININSFIELEKKMKLFYESPTVRKSYEKICFNARNSQPKIVDGLEKILKTYKGKKILEIGCGSGWLINKFIFNEIVRQEDYTGIDLEDEQIELNKLKNPNSTYVKCSSDSLPFENDSYDLIFSYFVLEHCVYPEKVLNEQKRVLKPGGLMVIICPDFYELGLLPSQWTGIKKGNLKKHLSDKNYLAFIYQFIDTRIRIPLWLFIKMIMKSKFLINLNPQCLFLDDFDSPDLDAVYLSSKREIFAWGFKQTGKSFFPYGTNGAFKSVAFVTIQK